MRVYDVQSSGVNQSTGYGNVSLHAALLHILDEDQASGIQNTLPSLQ